MLHRTSRSSHQGCSIKKGVLRNFTKFTGKHLCQSLRPATLLKKKLWHRCFPVNFEKFLRTPFLQNTSGRLLLNINTSTEGINTLGWKLVYSPGKRLNLWFNWKTDICSKLRNCFESVTKGNLEFFIIVMESFTDSVNFQMESYQNLYWSNFMK